jgi:CheY-like chemotaxis protein
VKVDVGSMEQVLMNLIVNARDAMPNGGELKLQTRVVLLTVGHELPHPDLRPGHYVVASVIDNGTGMTNEVRTRLFEPFFTTKPQGSGTGLGLAMCHGIVHQAGGAIAVRGECSVGTTFDIYLPLQQGTQIIADHKVATVTLLAGNETILIVEDEPMILQLVSSALEKRGYRILTANDGIEALEVATSARTKVDLLVTDVVMPRLGGRDLVNRLLQHHPQVKVLYMSGYAENSLAHRGELPRGLNFIQKPYQPDELAARIREILDRP